MGGVKDVGIDTVMQVDDGSSINIVREDVYRASGAKRTRCHTAYKVNGIGGAKHCDTECKLFTTMLGTRMGDWMEKLKVNISARFVITKNCPVPILIGSNTMSDCGIHNWPAAKMTSIGREGKIPHLPWSEVKAKMPVKFHWRDQANGTFGVPSPAAPAGFFDPNPNDEPVDSDSDGSIEKQTRGGDSTQAFSASAWRSDVYPREDGKDADSDGYGGEIKASSARASDGASTTPEPTRPAHKDPWEVPPNDDHDPAYDDMLELIPDSDTDEDDEPNAAGASRTSRSRWDALMEEEVRIMLLDEEEESVLRVAAEAAAMRQRRQMREARRKRSPHSIANELLLTVEQVSEAEHAALMPTGHGDRERRASEAFVSSSILITAAIRAREPISLLSASTAILNDNDDSVLAIPTPDLLLPSTLTPILISDPPVAIAMTTSPSNLPPPPSNATLVPSRDPIQTLEPATSAKKNKRRKKSQQDKAVDVPAPIIHSLPAPTYEPDKIILE